MSLQQTALCCKLTAGAASPRLRSGQGWLFAGMWAELGYEGWGVFTGVWGVQEGESSGAAVGWGPRTGTDVTRLPRCAVELLRILHSSLAARSAGRCVW